jgi:hypothetical protein
VINVTYLDPLEVVEHYKALDDIECGRRLKSELEIAPVHYCLFERSQAHASIYVLTMILFRVMPAPMSRPDRQQPVSGSCIDRPTEHLAPQHGHHAAPTQGVSTIAQDRASVLAALKIRKLSYNILPNLL